MKGVMGISLGRHCVLVVESGRNTAYESIRELEENFQANQSVLSALNDSASN